MKTQIRAISKRPSTLELSGETTFEFAAAADDKKLPTFTMKAYRGGPMRVSAWGQMVIIDLAGLSAAGDQIPIRLGHDRTRMVGHTDKVEIGAEEISASGVISFENPYAREVVASAKNGFKWQVSVGVTVAEDGVEYLPMKQTAIVNGRTVKGPMDIVRKGSLREMSFVDLGADKTTSAKVAAQQPKAKDMKTKTARAGTATEVEEEVDDVEETEEIEAHDEQEPSAAGTVIEQARRERKRVAEITKMVTAAIDQNPGVDLDAIDQIQSKAVEERWTLGATELALLRASRARAPAVHTNREQPMTDQVLAAAVLLSLGQDHTKLAKDPDFGERAVQAAWKHRHITLHGLIAAALKAEGISAPHGGQDLFSAAMTRSIRAGFSTVNLPGILGTVGNKLLLDSFTAVNAIYPRIAQQSDFNNFLTYTQYRLNDTGAFAAVGPDGELKHGTLSEDSYTNKLDTRGQMLTLTRQDIVNDDMNALQQLYTILGRKATLAVERAVIDAILESSDVFFTSGRGNKQTGSALSITTLAAAEALMAAQLDADSEPIYATPAILLVPPGLKFLADQIYTSAALGSGSSGSPTDNPFRGRFRVESSPYLALAALAGSHASTWYLLADPLYLPALQVAYLRGQRAPTIETADSTFNTLGMQMRCFFDFGIAQVDYRGAIKSVA